MLSTYVAPNGHCCPEHSDIRLCVKSVSLRIGKYFSLLPKLNERNLMSVCNSSDLEATFCLRMPTPLFFLLMLGGSIPGSRNKRVELWLSC